MALLSQRLSLPPRRAPRPWRISGVLRTGGCWARLLRAFIHRSTLGPQWRRPQPRAGGVEGRFPRDLRGAFDSVCAGPGVGWNAERSGASRGARELSPPPTCDPGRARLSQAPHPLCSSWVCRPLQSCCRLPCSPPTLLPRISLGLPAPSWTALSASSRVAEELD